MRFRMRIAFPFLITAISNWIDHGELTGIEHSCPRQPLRPVLPRAGPQASLWRRAKLREAVCLRAVIGSHGAGGQPLWWYARPPRSAIEPLRLKSDRTVDQVRRVPLATTAWPYWPNWRPGAWMSVMVSRAAVTTVPSTRTVLHQNPRSVRVNPDPEPSIRSPPVALQHLGRYDGAGP